MCAPTSVPLHTSGFSSSTKWIVGIKQQVWQHNLPTKPSSQLQIAFFFWEMKLLCHFFFCILAAPAAERVDHAKMLGNKRRGESSNRKWLNCGSFPVQVPIVLQSSRILFCMLALSYNQARIGPWWIIMNISGRYCKEWGSTVAMTNVFETIKLSKDSSFKY